MQRTDNLHVRSLTPIIAPSDLLQVFPLTTGAAEFVTRARTQLRDILYRRDRRLLVVVGPCSIHDPAAALDYAQRLAELNQSVGDQLFLAMRAYFEKPRTTVGWKGLINDPDLDGSHRISKGLGIARQLLCAITDLGLPIATETLDPISPQYLADLVSWGAIGARTTESQIHREMVSGLSFPVGIKNSTDGNLRVALDAMCAARHPHSFLGINHKGRASIVQTEGNPDVHLVLRGGSDGPNYAGPAIAAAEELIAAREVVPQSIVVDCSHANSGKDPERQPQVLAAVVEQVVGGNRSICGVMIESNLEAGSQPMPDDRRELRYGVSITDKCLGWSDTAAILREAAAALRKEGGRRV